MAVYTCLVTYIYILSRTVYMSDQIQVMSDQNEK
jgi:hypothetical protein